MELRHYNNVFHGVLSLCLKYKIVDCFTNKSVLHNRLANCPTEKGKSPEAEVEVVVVGEEVRFGGAGVGNWAIKFNHLLNTSRRIA